MRWGRHDDAAHGGWAAIGAPVAGTEGGVDSAQPGTAVLTAVDQSFDGDKFLAWAQTVYERAIAAWRTRDPEPLRAVMDKAVWDHYATHLLAVCAVPLAGALRGAAKATATFDGAAAGGGYQSVVVGFEVATDPAAFAALNFPYQSRTWQERWLFQRPVGEHTHVSGAVSVCPVCGAPAQPEETGRCRYCHADITTRTAGWLVTRTETTLDASAKLDATAARLRADAAGQSKLTPPPVAAPPAQPPRAGPPR
jgi:hypothetical protein